MSCRHVRYSTIPRPAFLRAFALAARRLTTLKLAELVIRNAPVQVQFAASADKHPQNRPPVDLNTAMAA
jgi:hypothetical protein